MGESHRPDGPDGLDGRAATEQWRSGRLVDPTLTESLCVHLVGLTPGLWCGACNTHPEHPDRTPLATRTGDPDA